MADHDPLPVAGYTSQSDEKIAAVNENKKIEERILRRLDSMAQDETVDKRFLAIGRTHIQEGFMAINRSILQPQRLTGDL